MEQIKEKPLQFWGSASDRSASDRSASTRSTSTRNPPESMSSTKRSFVFLAAADTTSSLPLVTKTADTVVLRNRKQSAISTNRPRTRSLQLRNNSNTTMLVPRKYSSQLYDPVSMSNKCLSQNTSSSCSGRRLSQLSTGTNSDVFYSTCDVKTMALMHVQRSFLQRSSLFALPCTSSICSDSGSRRSTKELKKLFCKGIKIVLAIVKICYAIRQYVSKPETLRELNHYSKDYEFSTGTVVFNKYEYSKYSSFNMPLWAKKLMEKDPMRRSSNDTQKLCSLLRKLKNFRDWFTCEKQLEFCRHCQYTRVDKRRILLRAGHKGYFCYLIISGSLFVNFQEIDDVTGKKYCATKTILKEGSLFGESSLMLNELHDVTIITRDNTELLVLDMEACMKVLPNETNRDVSMILRHIRQSEFLSDWPIHILKKLAECSELKKGVVEVVTSLKQLPIMEDSNNNEEDPFSETALFERLKSPNQCSGYRVKSPYYCSDTNNTVSFSLELLSPYSICDIRSLLPSSTTSTSSSQHLVLISHSSTVLKLPKLNLQTLPPCRCWRQLLLQARDTPRYPSDAVLLKIYQEHLQWSTFKSVVVKHTLDIKEGKSITIKPSRKKGISGWIGYLNPSVYNKDLTYEECLKSKVPLYKHVGEKCTNVHQGPCLLDYQPIINKYDCINRYYSHNNVK